MSKNPFVNRAICPELSKNIENMVLKIKELFNIEINKIQASKIISWKSDNFKFHINEKQLIQILGGKI